jgi:hypothetical protein
LQWLEHKARFNGLSGPQGGSLKRRCKRDTDVTGVLLTFHPVALCPERLGARIVRAVASSMVMLKTATR